MRASPFAAYRLLPTAYSRATRELAALLAVLTIVGAVALAFAWPWLPRPPTAGVVLDRYSPLRNGDARLSVRYGPDGAPTSWESQNAKVIAGLRITTDIRRAPADAILKAVEGTGSGSLASDHGLAALEIVETRLSTLGPDGQLRNTVAYSYRAESGDFLVGFNDPESDRDFIFDPPPMLLPPALSPGERWEREGTLGAATYRWTGQVLEQGPYAGPLGQHDDCLLTESRFVTTRDGVPNANLTRDRLCADVGIVESETLDPTTGALLNRLVVVANGGPLAPDVSPPPLALLPETPTPEGLDNWTVTRVGRARASGETTEATIPPTWLPTEPPIVLVAGYEGDLVAFDASAPGGLVRWRFHPNGTVYGPPAFDPASGRIYVGASDKRLYALDGRGLFLWSFQTGDNVATRPLVANDLVVFGSEDGTIYAVDAATGTERWTVRTGGAVVSSAALVGDVVAVGSDDQTVYGLDARTGERRWTYAAGGAVEAAVVADGEAVFVASRDGTLAALPAATCDGACAASWALKPGSAIRTAPLVADGRVLVVDEDGTLVALDTAEGRRLWTVRDRGYVGAPILVGDELVVARAPGMLTRLSLDGEPRGEWSATEAVTAADAEPQFVLGPSLGGDSVWIADAGAVVRRIGPSAVGDVPALRLAWFDQVGRPPFAQDQLRLTPVAYRERALLLDFGKRVFSIDPATGTGELLATLPGDAGINQVTPVVSGDTLLAIREQTLEAFDLRGRRELWQAEGEGTTLRPPVVAGDAVLWVTIGDGKALLQALDLATGALRWRADLPGAERGTGPVVRDGVVYVSAPPSAFDLATGARRWQAAIDGTPVGGPALSSDGETMYVGTLRLDGAGGAVLALDAASGAERWRADLADAVLNPLEQLWLEGDLLIVPSLNGKVIALDARSGAERWAFGLPVGRLGGVTVERGRVWFMLQNAHFYVLDARTGRPVARFTDLDVNLNGHGVTQRPLVIGDRVLMPIALYLLGFDAPEDAP